MMTKRPRRRRQTANMRHLVRETQLSVHDLIAPIFVKAGLEEKVAIASMPGQYQFPLADLAERCNTLKSLGIPAILLFGVPEEKDPCGRDACDDNGIIAQAIREIKQAHPDLLVIADTCFCEYTDHGHCGVMHEQRGQMLLDNDATLALLGEQAVVQARAGADIIAPSGMVDGMVATIRRALDDNGYQDIPILSYAVKYASSCYGPFRDATEGAPQYGDRKHYQMDPANANEALAEAKLDVAEGADMLMVKPAMMYLDIIHRVKQAHPDMPLAAYQVSGEYAMFKAAAEKAWLDETQIMIESLLAIKRAGADIIITYFAEDMARCLPKP